ncbi:MAG: nucleotidyltransferase family protein [Synechococcales cyanobacterium RM1_1_8]|nr:nucleotidyltransferase family protein [Synechococcales cyanobacterium RM1_1_8]
MVLALDELPIEIPQDDIAALCQRNHIRELALFGSVLRSDFRPESDVDILVEFEPGHTPGFAFIDIQDALTALLKRTVDLNTLKDLSRYFREEVREEARTIYVQE